MKLARAPEVGDQRFNDETNFLKHADRDPEAEIDDNFHEFTEAGISMAIGLYKSQDNQFTPEMASFLVWSHFMRPDLFDLDEDTEKIIPEWKGTSKTNANKIEDGAAARMYGDALLHWCRLNWSKFKHVEPR